MKTETKNKDKSKNDTIWVKNFSIEKAGYHLMYPALGQSLPDSLKILFGENTPLKFTDFFAVCEGHKNIGTYFVEHELQRVIDEGIRMIIENPAFVEKVHKEAYEVNKDYFDYAVGLLKKDFLKMTNKELGWTFHCVMEKQANSHLHAIVTTWYIDSYGETFSKYLIDKMKEIVDLSGNAIDFSEAFSILTTLPKNSMVLDEEIESLKVLKKIKENDKAKKMVLGLQDISELPDEFPKDVKNAIMAHIEKWRWSPFTYMGPAYDIDYYLQVWQGLLKEDIDVDEEIKKIADRPDNVKKKRERMIADLDISEEDLRIYDIAADIVFLKGYRKDVMFHGCYCYSFLLKEVAKRLYLSMDQIHLISHVEIENWLIEDKEVNLADINSRVKFSVLYNHNGRMSILIGKEAEEFLSDKDLKEEEIDADIDELHGTTACSGSAKGIAKIINTVEQIPKMEKGDIMVSHTTFPSLVPAMKKASAIITEDGGITCHAAIVSRELGTPCITGIRAATKIIKDGDELEVDASNGIVRIIRSASDEVDGEVDDASELSSSDASKESAKSSKSANYIKCFTEISKDDVETAGGKGASLGEMTNAGIPVPPGFIVLSEAFERFIHESGLDKKIETVLSDVDHEDTVKVNDASKKIQMMILAEDMPSDIAEQVSASFKELDSELVAVRSSATSEDSSDHAWAGQLDSFLNTDEGSLLLNVQKCWASLFTPRAIFYRFEKGLHNVKVSVAVVVQKMVQSEVSGIGFSVHPVTQDRNKMIIEAGYGLGEAVVSGAITPDNYIVEKGNLEMEEFLINEININKQEKALKRAETGNEWVDVASHMMENQKLSGKQIIELSKLMGRIEQHYGFPCDIEWALEDGEIFITQSRPITTLK